MVSKVREYSLGMKVTKERHDNFYRFVNVTSVLLRDDYIFYENPLSSTLSICTFYDLYQ